MLRERHFNRCLTLIGALWFLEVAWVALPGDPTMAGTPWGAATFFGGLLFGTWMRVRAAYWFLVVSEGLTVASLATFGQLLGLAVIPLVLCTGARFALLLSRPVRSMIGESRDAAAVTSAT
jgi:hypothetical protein